MSSEGDNSWEQHLVETAAAFSYPPTPNVAEGIRQRLKQKQKIAVPVRLLVPTALVALLLATALLAVPDVRATIVEYIRIGAVRIFATETAAPTMPISLGGPTLLDLAGATTWQAAQEQAHFRLRLPTYPTSLGPPDEVFQQRPSDPGLGDLVIIAVWAEKKRPDNVSLALYQIAGSSYALKAAAASGIVETKIHGERAYWVSLPHWIQPAEGEVKEWLFVEGSALIWVEDGITYRLEGAVSMDEAVRIAESLS